MELEIKSRSRLLWKCIGGMMNRVRVSPRVIGFACLLSFVCTGCASWSTLHQTPIHPYSMTPPASPQQSERVPGFLTDYRVTLNGTETTAQQNFINRFVNGLNRTGLFSTVKASPPEAGDGKYIDFRLTVDERVNSHQGMAAFKGALIAVTLFILTPALPLKVDFESDMALQARRWDGQTRNYSACCKGTANFHLFANPALAGQDVAAKVTGANINSLLNQVANDATFYRGK